MTPSDPSQNFSSGLSERDRRLLDLALQGCSDEAIAQELGVAIDAVFDGRLRLRRLLGTAFIGPAEGMRPLHEAMRKSQALIAEHRRLLQEVQIASERLLKAREVSAALKEGTIYRTALLHAAEAILIAGPPAIVLFANYQAARLFGADARDLKGLPVRDLTHAGLPEVLREPGRRLLTTNAPDREVYGVDQAFYGCRRDGTSFRAIAQAERCSVEGNPAAVVTMRELLGDAETLARALRAKVI